jgi:type IV pilus assembly protein PilQ
VKRGLALFLTVVTAGTLLGATGAGLPGVNAAPNAAAAGARLTAISSRVHSKGASLVIEATDPVGYVAARPDPLTITIDFRNVGAEGVSNSVGSGAGSPIAGVSVEPVESLGAPAARVRITLSQPVGHHVRSDRNTIVIDLDKPTGQPYILPAVAAQSSTASGQPPDAMKALEIAQSPVIDPLVVLGLTEPASAPPTAGGPGLSVANSPLLRPPPQPLAQAQAAMQARGAIQPPQAAGQVGLQGLQAQAQTPAPAGQAGTQFTGNPISLDFQGADLRAVLRSFAEISGLNMVIDPRVTGTVDVALRDVPWDQALDIILRANGLSYSVDGTIVRIAPVAVFAAENTAREQARIAAENAGDLTTLTRQLSYSRGEEIVALLKQTNILSSRGQASVDPRTNTLIITDLQDRLTSASDLITTIDMPQPQVEIEARIVQTNRNYARALGIQWGFTGTVAPELGNTTNLAFPNSGTLGGRAGPAGTAVNLPATSLNSAVGLSLGAVNGAFNLDVALSAGENSGDVKILSTPKVSTLNNVQAEIAQGLQVGYQVATNNTVTVQFRDAALVLRVLPQITAAGTVIMTIAVDNGSLGTVVAGIPSINTQRATTTVLVNDGQTTVIGGIYTSRTESSTDQTPGLSRIPLLGWFFKRESESDQNTELLIFITPRIIRNP